MLSQKLFLLSVTLIVSLSANSAQAAEAIVFSNEIKLYEELVFCAGTREQNTVLDELLINTEAQFSTCSAQIAAQQDIITDLNQALIDQQANCEQAVDLSKPSLWTKLKSASVFTAIGIIVGAVLL